MKAEYINPFLSSTCNVFSQMLDVEVTRDAPFIRTGCTPHYEVTGIVGLSGRTSGTVALSINKKMAIAITELLLGEQVDQLNGQVVDAIGEVTNMIAGGAKAQLESLNMSLGLPTVIVGKTKVIGFPSKVTPVSIPFDSPLGPLVVDVGILFL